MHIGIGLILWYILIPGFGLEYKNRYPSTNVHLSAFCIVRLGGYVALIGFSNYLPLSFKTDIFPFINI